MNADRLPPALEAFQTILSIGAADPAVSVGIFNATGITDNPEILFCSADVGELEDRFRDAKSDLSLRDQPD